MTDASDSAHQAELFRNLAAGYDDAIRRYQPTYDAMLRLSTDLARVRSSGRARCLDYGTGTGGALPYLSVLFDELVAIDPNKAMLDLARARANAECSNAGAATLTLIEGTIDAEQVASEPDRSFDAVHCSLVLMFVKDDADKLQLLRFFHRILRPGGALVVNEMVVDPDAADEQSIAALWRAVMRHRGASEEFVAKADSQVQATMHRRTPAQVCSLLERAGFGVIERPFRAFQTVTFLATA